MERAWEIIRHPWHCLAQHCGISSNITNATHFSTPPTPPTTVGMFSFTHEFWRMKLIIITFGLKKLLTFNILLLRLLPFPWSTNANCPEIDRDKDLLQIQQHNLVGLFITFLNHNLSEVSWNFPVVPVS